MVNNIGKLLDGFIVHAEISYACTWWVLVYTFDWFIFGFVKGLRDCSMTYRNDWRLFEEVF